MGVGRPIARTNFYEIEMKRLEVKWGGGKRPNERTGSEKTGRVYPRRIELGLRRVYLIAVLLH